MWEHICFLATPKSVMEPLHMDAASKSTTFAPSKAANMSENERNKCSRTEGRPIYAPAVRVIRCPPKRNTL